ncbi:MAG: hypothetical protein BZ135_00900 [Methanosphaera sp. rholeuAM6]|nr:MAG: hypothetical protein BZ135_00900 [Methanosphaera sp. rholeuAM6]
MPLLSSTLALSVMVSPAFAVMFFLSSVSVAFPLAMFSAVDEFTFDDAYFWLPLYVTWMVVVFLSHASFTL